MRDVTLSADLKSVLGHLLSFSSCFLSSILILSVSRLELWHAEPVKGGGGGASEFYSYLKYDNTNNHITSVDMGDISS